MKIKYFKVSGSFLTVQLLLLLSIGHALQYSVLYNASFEQHLAARMDYVSDEFINIDDQSQEIKTSFEQRDINTKDRDFNTDEAHSDITMNENLTKINQNISSVEEATPEEIAASVLQNVGAQESVQNSSSLVQIDSGSEEITEDSYNTHMKERNICDYLADDGSQIAQGITETGETLFGGIIADLETESSRPFEREPKPEASTEKNEIIKQNQNMKEANVWDFQIGNSSQVVEGLTESREILLGGIVTDLETEGSRPLGLKPKPEAPTEENEIIEQNQNTCMKEGNVCDFQIGKSSQVVLGITESGETLSGGIVSALETEGSRPLEAKPQPETPTNEDEIIQQNHNTHINEGNVWDLQTDNSSHVVQGITESGEILLGGIVADLETECSRQLEREPESLAPKQEVKKEINTHKEITDETKSQESQGKPVSEATPDMTIFLESEGNLQQNMHTVVCPDLEYSGQDLYSSNLQPELNEKAADSSAENDNFRAKTEQFGSESDKNSARGLEQELGNDTTEQMQFVNSKEMAWDESTTVFDNIIGVSPQPGSLDEVKADTGSEITHEAKIKQEKIGEEMLQIKQKVDRKNDENQKASLNHTIQEQKAVNKPVSWDYTSVREDTRVPALTEINPTIPSQQMASSEINQTEQEMKDNEAKIMDDEAIYRETRRVTTELNEREREVKDEEEQKSKEAEVDHQKKAVNGDTGPVPPDASAQPEAGASVAAVEPDTQIHYVEASKKKHAEQPDSATVNRSHRIRQRIRNFCTLL